MISVMLQVSLSSKIFWNRLYLCSRLFIIGRDKIYSQCAEAPELASVVVLELSADVDALEFASTLDKI